MMIPAKTDIKVALIGHVSVGKTTVLNALFRDKFGEVSMKRTTAGINYIRTVSKWRTANKKYKGDKKVKQEEDENGEKWTEAKSYDTKSAGMILKEITADNKSFRNSADIHEKFFDIELDESLCDMRDNADLVVVESTGTLSKESGIPLMSSFLWWTGSKVSTPKNN